MRALLLPLVVMVLVLTGPARAGGLPADIQRGFDTRLLHLAPADHGATRCWLRRVGATDLAVRALGLVPGIALCIRIERLAPDVPPAVAGEIVRYRYNFHLTARLPGDSRPLHMVGECGWAYAPIDVERAGGRKTWCSVECDGGSIEIEPARHGDWLLVRLDRQRSAGGCGSDLGTRHTNLLARGWNGGLFLSHRIAVAGYRTFAGEPHLFRDPPPGRP